MSNARAIATVTATLRHSLQNAINADLPGATVTSVRPDGAGSGIPPVGVNIFLYQISPNAALRNADLPSRSQDGTLVQRPRAALDLHYLFSFYGDEAKLEPQQLAGAVARTLHERAILTRKMITAALAPAGAFNFLNPSDLADETETVRLTPLSLSLEEMAKLWSVFFQTSYALSVAYQASVVLIESSDMLRTPLPVRERTLTVLPFRAPRIDDVISELGAGLPILAGSSITVRGQQLRGEVTRLRVASGEITPALDKLRDEEITVPLLAGLRAGVNSVQVVQKLKLGVPPVEHSGFEFERRRVRPRAETHDHHGQRGQLQDRCRSHAARPPARHVAAQQHDQRCTVQLRSFAARRGHRDGHLPRLRPRLGEILCARAGGRCGKFAPRPQPGESHLPAIHPTTSQSPVNDDWLAANQQALSGAVAQVRAALERWIEAQKIAPARDLQFAENAAVLDPPAAFVILCAAFALSPFERDVLLLCAGIELDARFAPLCGAAQGNPARTYPSFSLALAALPEAHWSAITPDAALRRWRLIEIVGNGEALTASPLRIDERILHFLTGLPGMDERLRGLIQPIDDAPELPPSHDDAAAKIARLCSDAFRSQPLPLIQLCGRSRADKRVVAAAAAARLGIRLHRIDAADLPTSARERESLIRLWGREAVLTNAGLLIEADDREGHEQAHSIAVFAENLAGVVLISAREPARTHGRAAVRIDIPTPAASEQRALWEAALGPMTAPLNDELDDLLGHFHLDARSIREIGARAASPEQLWSLCRSHTRPRLGALAQRIEAAADWADLVLPEPQMRTLEEISVHVHQRTRVYQTWGFGAKGSRGLGISALFVGPSGTGKTMAAEVLAHELRLDLYRIELSQVVSKYIGETEKNLRSVFEAAEGSGAILLFDEADALFGKRTEARHALDRFANIEVSYLLQQMEAYRGLAILTTNMRNALDPAFLRRIRFVVQFPFPGAVERAEIWRRIFPAETPTDQLDMEKLSRLNVAGGNIRNIVLNAAFLAAGAKQPVRMTHLLRAAQTEYEKLEKPLTDSETEGWL